jgi:hypothetical protein
MVRQRLHAGAAWALLWTFAAGCGAGDKTSDVLDPNPLRCPTIEEIAPTFLRLLREDRFAGLREVLEQDLGVPLDPAQPAGATRLSALLGVFLEVVRAVDVPGFGAVLRDALRSTSAGPLLPQTLGVLRYIDGRVGCPSGTRCDHYDLLDVLRRLLFSGTCTEAPARFDARTELDLLYRLVRHPRIPEILDLLPRLVRSASFQQVLDGFRFEGCDTPPCEQENGFAALLDVVLTNLLVSPLPWGEIRNLLRQVRLDTPEVLALISLSEELLTERPAEPDADVLSPLRAAIRCLRQVDPGRALLRNAYRLLALDEVSLDGLFAGVDHLLDADPRRLTLQVLAQALDYFRARSLGAFRTLQIVGDVLLAPTSMRKVIPVLIALVEEGVVPELVDLLVALTGDCTTIARP